MPEFKKGDKVVVVRKGEIRKKGGEVAFGGYPEIGTVGIVTAFRTGKGSDLANRPKGGIDIYKLSEPSGRGRRTRWGGLEDEVVFPDEIELFSKKIKKTTGRLPTQRRTIGLRPLYLEKVI